MVDRTLVIIGASVAGAKAAEAARATGFDGRVVLVGDEPELPYERPPLSKAVLRGEAAPETTRVHDQDFYATNDIELLTGRTVEAVDVDRRPDPPRRPRAPAVLRRGPGDGRRASAPRRPRRRPGRRPLPPRARRRPPARRRRAQRRPRGRGRRRVDRLGGRSVRPPDGRRGRARRPRPGAAPTGPGSRGRGGVPAAARRQRRPAPAADRRRRAAGHRQGRAGRARRGRDRDRRRRRGRHRCHAAGRAGPSGGPRCRRRDRRRRTPAVQPARRATPQATSPSAWHPHYRRHCASSTGPTPSTRGRRPVPTPPVAPRPTRGCPTSSPTSTTSAWSTSASAGPTTRS